MTAEVALLNREAVALAADSAVTIGAGSAQKIFPSAQKLFPLSYRYPVGIMFYNNATLVGVPWEAIIKTYRAESGNKRFERLKEHAEDVIRFVQSDRRLFSKQQQEQFYLWSLSELYRELREQIDKRAGGGPGRTNGGPGRASGRGTGRGALPAIVEAVVEETAERFRAAPVLPSMAETSAEALLEEYGNRVEDVKRDLFRDLPLGDGVAETLTELAGELFMRQAGQTFPEWTGMAIAGFGNSDFFPSLQHFQFEGVVADTIRFTEKEFVAIDFATPANIIPFAQNDGVRTFIDGIEPRYAQEVESAFEDALSALATGIRGRLRDIDPRAMAAVEPSLDEIIAGALDEQRRRLADFRRQHMAQPVLNVVSALPKDELADMAEALVNLTSFKRRLSMDPETVGGPIDVAVISKGDGFVWIKRKDYYESALNVYAPRTDVDEALSLLKNLGIGS
jgi:hypothetical protein